MKAFLLALPLFLAPLLGFAHPGNGGHLTFAGGKFHAHLSWAQGPDKNGGESKMRLEWKDGETHSAIEPDLPFQVSLWMPSMDHGSAPTQIRRVLNRDGQVELGAYEITNMFFIMPGDWEIRVSVKHADGTEEAQAWAISIEGDGGHHH